MDTATEPTDVKEHFQDGFEQQIDRLQLNQEKLTIVLAQLTERYNAAPIGIVSLGEQLTVSDCNHTFATMVGAKDADLQGSPFSSLVVKKDRQMFRDNHQKWLRGQLQTSYELRLKCPTGQALIVWVDYIPPLPSKKQADCHIALRKKNISKELEELLQKEISLRQEILEALPFVTFLVKDKAHEVGASNQAKLQITQDEQDRKVEKRSAELEQSHRLLRSFEKLAAVGRVVMAVSRQFNDPLQAITNVLGGIHRRGSLEPEDKPLLNLAYEEVKKLNTLVTDLREFYQPTLGKTSLFDIRTELVEMIKANKRRLSDINIHLTTNWPEEMPLIHAVPEQLRTVFESLLASVVARRPHTTAIHITASIEKGNIIVQVEDGNRSTDRTQIPQLYDPFHPRMSKSLAKNFGLAKSYAIVTTHGGKMETTGDEEKGAGFMITLPLRRKSGLTNLTIP